MEVVVRIVMLDQGALKMTAIGLLGVKWCDRKALVELMVEGCTDDHLMNLGQ